MKRIATIIVLLALASGCESFGTTQQPNKYPNLLDSVRHFYREPLWTRDLHRHHGNR